MKKFFVIAALAVGAWFAYQWAKRETEPVRIKQSVPVRYVGALKQDVKRAQDSAQGAEQKAEEAMQQLKQTVGE